MTYWDSEIEEAKEIAGELSFLPQAFKFEIETVAGEQVKQPTQYKITVTFNRKSKIYDGGEGLEWLSRFEDDLREGWDGATSFKQRRY